MDRRAWWATVHRVAKLDTTKKQDSTHARTGVTRSWPCVLWWELVYTWTSESRPVREQTSLWSSEDSLVQPPGERERVSQLWAAMRKAPSPGGPCIEGDVFTFFFMLPRFSLSKLLGWNIIAFHFIFKNCCQGSLLASWSQHKSENTLLQGKIFFFLNLDLKSDFPQMMSRSRFHRSWWPDCTLDPEIREAHQLVPFTHVFAEIPRPGRTLLGNHCLK